MIAAAACAVVVVVAVGIALAAFQPWNAGGSGQDGGSQGGGAAVLSEAAGNRGFDSPEAVTQAEGWAVDMFCDLAVMVGRGEWEAWVEVGEGGDWDFYARDPAGGRARYFAVSEEFALQAQEAGVSGDVWGCIEYANRDAESYAGAPFSDAGAGEAAVEVGDASGEGASYADGESLRALAQAAYAYAASARGRLEGGLSDSQDGGEQVNEWGYTESEMEYIAITPDGEAIMKGSVYAVFRADTPRDRIREVVAQAGGAVHADTGDGDEDNCAFRYGDGEGNGSFHAEDGDWETVTVHVNPVGAAAEWDVAAALEGFPEVVEVEFEEPLFCEDDAVASSSAVAAGEDGAARDGSWEAYLQYYLRYSGFEEAWEASTCDGRVAVGIIDSGVDYENGEIASNVDTARMANSHGVYKVEGAAVAVGGDADMTDYGRNSSGNYGPHGTYVAGVVSAVAGDDYGCDGASYNALMVPVKKTGEDGTSSLGDVVEAYRYLVHLEDPPEVINISSSTKFTSREAIADSEAAQDLQELVDEAWEKGIVTVASAGNDGEAEDADGDGDVVEHEDYNLYSVPACLDHVLSVGALQEPGWGVSPENEVPELCSFSNTASDVDICAYGDSIYTVNAYAGWPYWYAEVSGTSFSAPMVASAAALVCALHPDWGAQDVVDALLESAEPMLGEDGQAVAGTGAGALDAAAAVAWEPDSGGSSSGGSSGGSTAPDTGGTATELILGFGGDAS